MEGTALLAGCGEKEILFEAKVRKPEIHSLRQPFLNAAKQGFHFCLLQFLSSTLPS